MFGFFSAGYNKLSCSGQRCSQCGQCRDWFYRGDLPTLEWLQNWKRWSKRDWENYRDNEINDRFTKRPNAECTYFLCIIDGDDINLALQFHKMGANPFYHAHQDLCLCNDNARP